MKWTTAALLRDQVKCSSHFALHHQFGKCPGSPSGSFVLALMLSGELLYVLHSSHCPGFPQSTVEGVAQDVQHILFTLILSEAFEGAHQALPLWPSGLYAFQS